MENFLAVAVGLLTVAVAVDLLITFALIRRVRASEAVDSPVEPSAVPSIGAFLGDFDVTADDGSRLTRQDVEVGTHRFVFVLPECGGCGELIAALDPAAVPDPALTFVVAGMEHDPATDALVSSIPADVRVVRSPLGGGMSRAFKVAAFPTVVSVTDGQVARVSTTLESGVAPAPA